MNDRERHRRRRRRREARASKRATRRRCPECGVLGGYHNLSPVCPQWFDAMAALTVETGAP